MRIARVAATKRSLRTSLPRPATRAAFLSPADQESFAREIVAITRACASVARFDKALVTLRAWRSTAEAISAGYTPDDKLDWIEPTTVADPRTA